MPNENLSREIPTTFVGVYQGVGAGWPFYGYNGAPVMVQVSEQQKSWVRTPNFWQLRRSGAILPENEYTLTRWNRSGSDALFLGYRAYPAPGYAPGDWRSVSLRRNWVQRSLVTYNHGVTLAETELYIGLINKARTSQFSLPITIIEARKTASMVTQTARTLAGTIFDLRRGNLVGAVRRLGLLPPSASQQRRFNRHYGTDPTRAASNAWLQYQYGWKPLLNDVKNGAEALAEAVSRNGESMVTSVRNRTSLSRGGHVSNALAESDPPSWHNVTWHTAQSWRAVWRFRTKPADLPGLFGLTNPFEVAWEIIPFSFVADWFIPIGGYLSALDAPLRFEHVGGSKGYRRMDRTECTPTQCEYGGLGPMTALGGHGSSTYLHVHRWPLTSIPTPSLSSLTFEPRLGATRVTSAIALLRQQASRLSR